VTVQRRLYCKVVICTLLYSNPLLSIGCMDMGKDQVLWEIMGEGSQHLKHVCKATAFSGYDSIFMDVTSNSGKRQLCTLLCV
jgi:hypothetical protein